MKEVKFIQGTPEWLEYRRTRIGASDAPVIMGLSPYATPYELWMQKISGIEVEVNQFMQRGKDLEKIALKKYMEMTGISYMDSPVIENKDYPWQCASLDGMTKERDLFVEIKCPGEKNHEKALRGEIPKNYFIQMQHQLLVTGLDLAHYFSFDGIYGIILDVKRDEELLSDVFERELRFWDCLKNHVPPEMLPKDVKKYKTIIPF